MSRAIYRPSSEPIFDQQFLGEAQSSTSSSLSSEPIFDQQFLGEVQSSTAEY